MGQGVQPGGGGSSSEAVLRRALPKLASLSTQMSDVLVMGWKRYESSSKIMLLRLNFTVQVKPPDEIHACELGAEVWPGRGCCCESVSDSWQRGERNPSSCIAGVRRACVPPPTSRSCDLLHLFYKQSGFLIED